MNLSSFFGEKIFSFFRRRGLQTDILFAFMSILSLSMLMIIGYTFFSNSKTIIEQSQTYLKSSASKLKQDIYEKLRAVEIAVETFTPILSETDLDQITTNINMIQAMTNVLNAEAHMTTLYFGTQQGLFFEVGNPIHVGNYVKLIGGQVPENTTSVFKIINHEPHNLDPEVSEKWYFVQGGRTILPPQPGTKTAYDHRKRAWYMNTSKSQRLEWSPIYVFASTLRGESGLTASKTLLDNSGRFRGVFAADITLKTFSEFLAKSKISPNAKAFILDEKGQVVATSENKASVVVNGDDYKLLNTNTYGNDLLSASESLYQTNKGKEDFLTFTHQEKDYLAAFEDFPKNFSNAWRAVIIAPADDFVLQVKQNRNRILIYSCIILLISSLLSYRLARRISVPIKRLAKEANNIRDLKLDGKLDIRSHILEIDDLTRAMSSLKNSMESFSYYIPRSLVKKLLQNKKSVHVGGKSKEVTLLFSDIQGFTSISEEISAEKLVNYLSEYFEEMNTVISNTNGTIDKFIGDAIMAFWGAPLADRHHAFNACRAALLMQKRLDELNRLWKIEGRPIFYTRMGIHTGNVIIGNIGSSERMNYTAIGDSVNLCSRLEGLNKFYGTRIIASETVYDHWKDHFLFRPLDKITVKGKSKAVNVFELMAQIKGDNSLLPLDEDQEFHGLYLKAYHLYMTRQFPEALKEFENIPPHLHRGDLSVSIYIERCKAFIANPPPHDWDGVFHRDEK